MSGSTACAGAGAVPSPGRRRFLQCAGAGLVAAAAGSLVGAGVALAADNSEAPADEAFGVLIDLTRCTGCQSCALACKAANRLPNAQQAPIKLDSDTFTFVDERPLADGETRHVKRQCMHCVHPACVSACTVGALRKTDAGPVVYDADKCIGCRYCQYACPFGVPTYQWSNPLGLIQKCQMCVTRLAEGERPACVAACPNGVLRFGKRSELVAQAHGQIASNPGRYLDHVYGEYEAGGTSMLYLSAVPFAELGLPALDNQPVPRYAEAIMRNTPAIALTAATVATTLSLLLRRRAAVAEFTLRERNAGSEAAPPAGSTAETGAAEAQPQDQPAGQKAADRGGKR